MRVLRVHNNKISSNYFTQPKKEPTSMEKGGVILPDNISTPHIIFNAKIKFSNKKINIETEKNRILKLLNEELGITASKSNVQDAAFKAKLQRITMLENEAEKIEALFNLVDETNNNPISDSIKFKRISLIRRLAIKIKSKTSSINPKTYIKSQQTIENRFDYKLTNRLKTSIEEEDFRLKRVYKNYYSELANITSIEELKQKYPAIKVPPRPEKIIADRIINTLTRDFYVEFNNLLKDQSSEAANFMTEKLYLIINSMAQKYKFKDIELVQKLTPHIIESFNAKFLKHVLNDFSSIPEFRKNPIPQITENDTKLLKIDFEDFVLSTIKKHYLESQKLNQIKYQDANSDVSITVNSLSNSEYKFEKFPEKLQHIINAGETILRAQRNYQEFDFEYLKNKLEFYAETNIGKNLDILKTIMDFYYSEEEDKDQLMLFLRELDNIYDDNQSEENAIKNVRNKDIRPKNKHKINEIERQKAIMKVKKEQELKFKLDKIKNDFDDAINILYANNLTNIANICASYRPKKYSPNHISRTEFIVNQINRYLNSETEPNITRLESSIAHWDTYQKAIEMDLENPVLKKAKAYAKDKKNNIDIIKAGQYLNFAEIVDFYPESLDLVDYPELLTKIIEKTEDDKDSAIKYLCKYNDYEMLTNTERAFLSQFIELFDMKDSVDKQIIKYIIDNDYIYSDSTTTISLNDATTANQEVTIASSAKQAIYEKYKFPNCIDLFESFESALSNLARAKGESGIKQIGRNKKTSEYKIELKLNKYPDRLFSSKNDFCFDIYSEKGLH